MLTELPIAAPARRPSRIRLIDVLMDGLPPPNHIDCDDCSHRRPCATPYLCARDRAERILDLIEREMGNT